MNERPTHLDLFSGIGGFALAARWAGFRTVGFCEIDKYCQKVLAKNFDFIPFDPCDGRGPRRTGRLNSSSSWKQQQTLPFYRDIRSLPGGRFQGVSLITGGFPCQPFSVAGKRRGKDDDRAIWPEMFRVIKEARPAWVLGENVPGIIPMELDNVLSDLESIGYTTRSFVIPACAVDARHRRDRIWIVGFSERGGQETRKSTSKTVGHWNTIVSTSSDAREVPNTIYDRSRETRRDATLEGSNESKNRLSIGNCSWLPEPDVGRVVARLPAWLDGSGGINEAEVLRAMQQFDGATTLEEWRTRLDFFKTPILLQSLLWRLANGTKQVAHESCVTEASTKSVPENDELRAMRIDRELAKASSESQRCVLCGDSLSEMPHEGRNIFGQMGQTRNRVNRLKGLGNAVVPQVAYEILKEIRKLI